MPSALKRPDIEFFIPEYEVMKTGSHAGIFELAILASREKLGGKPKMIAHQTVDSPAGYIVYAWIEANAN